VHQVGSLAKVIHAVLWYFFYAEISALKN